jgi:hypothetical protein
MHYRASYPSEVSMPPPSALYIKPARPGLIVRDPATKQPLAEAGEEKPRITYWLRRRDQGDVVETARPAPATQPKTSKKEDP